MTANDCNEFRDLALGEPAILCKADLGRQPELRFPLGGCDMHVETRLFAREKEKPVRSLSEDCRAHGAVIVSVRSLQRNVRRPTDLRLSGVARDAEV